nr:unnamed protein product [Digitaria exilis]
MYIIVIGRCGNNEEEPTTARKLAGAAAVAVKLVVFAMILCPLCGLYINAAISVWRLIKHDFHAADGDPSKANMNPALDVLYSLALVQGLLFGYKELLVFTEKKLVNVVVKEYSFEQQASKSVSDYLSETKVGCAKDPSFSRGRNLITYAVDLMDSKSPDNYTSGVRILDTIIRRPDDHVLVDGNRELIRRLLGSASSSHILQKMLQTLDSRSPRDRAIRLPTARILALLAGNIRLQQFRRGVQSLSSLLETCLEEDEDGSCSTNTSDQKELLSHGLCIFGDLAIDEGNCRAMSNNRRLISKITAPNGPP